MLKIALGAEFNTEKMYKDVAELASRYKGVQLHTHVAENPVSTWPSVSSICIEIAAEMAISACHGLLSKAVTDHNAELPLL